MKNIYTFLLLLIGFNLTAQQTSNIIIFAEDATPFYAIVNGIKQNIEPQTNVKITGLTNPNNQVKIIFKNASIPSIDKALYFQEMNVEATMKISNTKSGYKLRYFGEVSMGTAPIDASQNIIVYHPTEIVETTLPVNNSVTTTTVQETTTINSGTKVPANNSQVNTEQINVNMNMAGVGINMNVNVNDNMGMNESITTSTTDGGTYTSTTTTTTTSTSNLNTTTNVGIVEPQVVYVDGYSGRTGCAMPLQDCGAIKSAIKAESFSDDKMMVAKQGVKNRCLTTSQVKEIASLFDFEDDRLEFAKHAYSSTYDVENYYQLNSLFNFSSTKEELNDFTKNK